MKKVFIPIIISILLFGCSGSAEMSFYKKPNAKIDLTAPAVILSDKAGMFQDMTFADIFSTELLKDGMNLMDRSTLQGLLKEKGFDWNNILSQQQYIKIGTSSPVRTILIVNAQMYGQTVYQASCRVIDAITGELLMSMNITNPSVNSLYIGNESTSSIAKNWADNITGHNDSTQNTHN
jgi:hypothetical protein